MEIGTFIKEKRKAKSLTLRELANSINLSHSYLSQIENGQRKASPELLEKLSKSLDVDYMQLLEKAGYISEENITLTKEEEEAFEAAAFLKTSEELYTINQQLAESKSVEDKKLLIERRESLEKQISNQWKHYDELLKDTLSHLSEQVELIEMNKNSYYKGTPTPIWVDSQNNINIQIYTDGGMLNPEDTKTLNSMIKGFLFDKKFLDYNDEN